MGTSIELTVSGVSLAYAKNNMGHDFGYLFRARIWRVGHATA
ncbi:hypothetical protein I6F07_27845 [Ensifer sp. IC4062]|nr:hypothetical protein [Ensifer sp. IC4062]